MCLRHEYDVRVRGLTPFFETPDRAAYRADTDRHRVVVRVFPPTRPLERVAGDAAALRYAAAAGIPAEPLVLAAGGRPFVDLDGRGVLVTGHVGGDRPPRDADSLRQLGEIAGRLCSLRPPPDDPLLNRRAGSLPAEDLASGRAWLASARGSVPASWHERFDRVEAALAATSDLEHLPRSLIHSDCQLLNAIRAGDGRVVLIDWEGAGLGPRIVPLGLVLYSCVVQTADEPDRPVDLALVEAIARGFAQHASIGDAELNHLADAVRFRPLVIATRELARGAREGRIDAAAGWWSRYAEADAIGRRARAALASSYTKGSV
jgi:Ser/Thr protein kinase RdoA (MazF antagonist)